MKKIIGALLTAVLVLSFAGCDLGVPEETVAPTEPPELTLEIPADQRPYLGVELKFASPWRESDPEADVLAQAAEVFEKRTGARLEILYDGSDADIFAIPAEELAQRSGEVLYLTELAAASGYEARSHGVLRQQVTDACGFLGGIPYAPELEGLYYNREIFDSCGIETMPETWEEFLQVCTQLKAAEYQSLVMNSENAAHTLQLHLHRALGTAQLESLKADGGWLENEQAVTALQQIVDFAAEGYVVTAEYPGGQDKLARSNAAMILGTWQTCREIEAANAMDLTWGVFPWPGGAEGGCYASSDVLAIRSGCGDPQAAFDFVMLLTTGEFDQLRADATGGIPADPGNSSAVSGAVEALQSAQLQTEWVFKENLREYCLQLWEGGYSKGSIFAAALDQLL